MPIETGSEFHGFYHEYFGARWPKLVEALQQPETKVHRWNRFCASPNYFESCHALFLKHASAFDRAAVVRDAQTGLLQTYVMDPSSIYGAQALGVQPGDRVLDMCAAPGGKSLILAEALMTSGELIANEMSRARRSALIKVIQDYLPMSVRERVFVTGWEGGALGAHRRQQFERILLDAPCSGERYLLRSVDELKQWNPNKSKKLALRQYALLTAALEAGVPGARIVYSTCSFSPFENDAVIEKLLVKKPGRFKVASAELTGPEFGLAQATQFGFQFLPDHHGLGPFYLALLQCL